MTAFINGVGNISPQKTWDNKYFLKEITGIDSNCLPCEKPGDYEKFIDPKLLRRMSRIIRMSYTAARICLEDATVEIPDAIITGSGMGCLEDTEKFLNSIYQNDEKLLPPTPFIQSTHNTIGAQLALMLQCTGYNLTYSQRGLSFENALTDALMHLDEKNFHNILVGGFDEMTPNQMILYNRLHYYKTVPVNNLNLIHSGTSGTIAGEGNAFFILGSEKKEHSYAAIQDVATFNDPPDMNFVIHKIHEFLASNQVSDGDIDLCLGGYNGDAGEDKNYDRIFSNIFRKTSLAGFKHLCGEYHTASAFAVWLAASILKRNQVPEAVQPTPVRTGRIKNILIYNHYRNRNHSLILLSSCR